MDRFCCGQAALLSAALFPLLPELILLTVLFAAACTDLTRRIIPNRLLLAALFLRALLLIGETAFFGADLGAYLQESLTALLIPLLVFLIGALLYRGGIGMGDIKLLCVTALYLGAEKTLTALLISLLSAALWSLYRMARKEASPRSRLPLAPFFMIGATVTLLIPAA